MSRPVLRLLVAASLLIAVSAAADPPGRAVRLNLTDGLVSFRPADVDEWTDALVNRPLIDGDELWTTETSRAELHVGSAAVRLAPSTSFGIVAATDRLTQLRLNGGTLNVHVRALAEDDAWEIDTPNAVVSLQGAGRYRVEVSDDGLLTAVTVWDGAAQLSGGDSSFIAHAGELGQVSGEEGLDHDLWEAPDPDAFDRWCSRRDQHEERVASLDYVPRDVVGYEDLDEYGSWRFVASYGWLWQPRVAADWAPYRQGHWAWIKPWGWTWLDAEPWGFAPFHYGRWAYVSGGWAWVPGDLAHPVYAPALVVFGGSGQWEPNVVAWWPLAPGEIYVPAYHAGPDYVRNINAPTVNVMKVDVTKVDVRQARYANQTVGNAVTAVVQDAFASGKLVARSTVPVAVTDAKPIGAAAPVAPRVISVIGTSSSKHVAMPPNTMLSRRVVARTAPPPAAIPFTAKQQVLSQDPGKPLDATASDRLRVRAGAPPKIQVIDKLPVQEKPRTKAHPPETTDTTPAPMTVAPPPERKPRTRPTVTTTVEPTPTQPATTSTPPPETHRHSARTPPPPPETSTTSTSGTASTAVAPKPKSKSKEGQAEEKKKDEKKEEKKKKDQ